MSIFVHIFSVIIMSFSSMRSFEIKCQDIHVCDVGKASPSTAQSFLISAITEKIQSTQLSGVNIYI